MFDPFALLGLTKQYKVEEKMLEEAYFKAQQKAHPDRFVGASFEDRQEASRHSTSINQAYLVLKDPLQRAEYLLRETPHFPDSTFLEQVINWKEQLGQGISLKDELSALQKTLFQALEKAFEKQNYGEAKTTLYKLQYIQKMT